MALSTRGLKAVIGTSLTLLLMAVWPAFGSAAGAVDELRPAIGRVLRILADPELKGEERTRERRTDLDHTPAAAIRTLSPRG